PVIITVPAAPEKASNGGSAVITSTTPQN
ncbi:MAG: hypothetical protein JWR59_1400, partial [Brevundimonas sp.]|nr:hypothetical protein [Brevundimonas sp.]